nr:MAG TPA: ENDO-1,4-BETA-XYLANASE Y [Caudoviricetes sp.]
MWVVGDWGQDSPWSRTTGVKMVKGDDDVYTGELSIPKGTKFDIKILKSTVSTTSGGDNTWSAVRYASTLNTSTSHDFGEFIDNLIPNGNFEEGKVKWTPAECINLNDAEPFDGKNVLVVGAYNPTSCASDVFVIPPNQTLRLTGYARNFKSDIHGGVTMKVVTPQQQTLFEFSVASLNGWSQFSRTFETAGVPMECQIVLSNKTVGGDWHSLAYFDSLSLVSP